MASRSIPFTKMQGLGNDFIVIDSLVRPLDPLTSGFAKKICDRRFGVGADQILWLKEPKQDKTAHARMEILNADGTRAEMCGNGVRAVALYLQKYGPEKNLEEYRLGTEAGPILLKITAPGTVAVDMGVPKIANREGEDLEVDGQKLHFWEISMGNPHAVFFTDELSKVSLGGIGPAVETHTRFPNRTNVEFVQILAPSEIRVGVWERGSGITLACGTGACAAAVAALLNGKVKSPVKVQLPGGTLKISWEGEGHSVIKEGPATEVFRGEYFF